MNPYYNIDDLLKYGNQALDLIGETYQNLEKERVVPDVEPGFLRQLLPENPPQKGESFEDILNDTKTKILPNLTQWQHPNFYAYFPCNMSSAAIIGDMISLAFNSPGFTWIASPATTELENIVADWIVKMMNLPEKFLLKNSGGGAILASIGISIFYSIHAGKYRKMKELGIDLTDPKSLKFVGYYTSLSHSENQRGLLVKDIPYRRAVPVHWNEKIKNFSIDVQEFREMVEKDISDGLIPFWCGATIGTTPCGSVDPIPEIAEVCKKYGMWLNVDAAWAGGAFVVPELRQEYGAGLEEVDSLTINFAKGTMSGNGSALFFVGDKKVYNESLGGKINPEYLKNKFTEENDITDYKDWQLGLGKRFNSLRLWFVIRKYGVEGLQKNILDKIELTKYFESLVTKSDKFTLVCKRSLNLICFRMIKDKDGNIIPEDKLNEFNRKLLELINLSGHYYLVGSEINGLYFLRFTPGNHNTLNQHIDALWKHIEECALKL